MTHFAKQIRSQAYFNLMILKGGGKQIDEYGDM